MTTTTALPAAADWPPGVTARYTTAYGMRYVDRTAYVETTRTTARCTGCPASCPPGHIPDAWARDHANTCTGQPRT